MSQDGMQALSGSSMLSLSVGTLPAVKSGMMLNANPFASHLALMTGPQAAASGASAAGVAVPALADGEFALALADAVVPETGTGKVPAAQMTPVAASTEIPVLPEDASPSQIIEAVLGGAMAPAAAVAAKSEPQDNVLAAAETPALNQATPQAMPEAVATDTSAADPHPARMRRAVRQDEPVATAAEAVPVAPAVVQPVTPVMARPQKIAPETGNVPVAVSANPSVVSANPPVSQGTTASTTASTGTADIFPATPQAGMEASAPEPAPRLPASPLAATEPVATPTAPAQMAAPAVSATPGAATQANGAVSAEAAPVVIQSGVNAHVNAPGPVSSSSISLAPISSAPTAATPGTEQASTATPAPVLAEMAKPAPAAQTIQPAQVSVAQSPVPQAPVPRAAAPAARAAVSINTQRAVQAASQTARPAQALSALFNLADPAAQPVSAATGMDTPGALTAETVPPSWAAALNAVVSPAPANMVQGLTAPVAAGSAHATPLETLAFDAGFVGSVETQIARVIGGGQMVRMQISPENLGRIDIEMLAGPERNQVRIVTEHDAVRDTLVQSQVRLEQDLRGQGNRNTDVTVELRQQSPGTSTNLGGGSAQQRGQSGQEAGLGREAIPRQTAADALTQPDTAHRRPRGNVRYA